jgi:TolB-like protein/DNA-binding winged helix-turn-helix (wHTH) protein/cytochrome c-type biogenesis protein CcmH/NrfG
MQTGDDEVCLVFVKWVLEHTVPRKQLANVAGPGDVSSSFEAARSFISTISCRIGTVSYSIFLCAVLMHTLSSRRVLFGAFELDLSTGELRSTEGPNPNNKVLLREQVFQVLRMLLEREGEMVTREEIKGRLWANDTVVDFDHSINTTIKALRRALGDSADDPRYIETLARRGYRLMVMTEYMESAPGTALEKDREQSAAQMSHNAARVQPRVRPHWWKAAVVLAPFVILVGASFISWRYFRAIAVPRTERIRLAVLPFENLTGDPNQEYLTDGLTEETISQLSRLNPEQLGVIARTSVMEYKHKDVRLDQIARDLSVQYVLENSLRASGNHLRLTAQLIQVKDQTPLWSKDYDYSAKDILNVEDELAKEVAHWFQLRLPSQRQGELARTHPVNAEAYDAFMKGYYFFQRGADDKDTNMAATYFERATHLDPSYARAWVGLSRARYWQANIGLVPTQEGQQLARDAVERALTLDPNLPEANIQMGRIKRQVDFDFAGADFSIQRAIALEPGVPENLGQAAFMAELFGRFDEALTLDRQALELDPLNAESWEYLAENRFYAGQLDEAVADIRKALELNADTWGSPIIQSEIYLFQGRPQDALRESERIPSAVFRIRTSAMAYHALGREKESDATLRELIEKFHANAAWSIATVYALRNQRDEAFKWLDRAYAQHDGGLIFIKIDPLLKNLHGDPRYTAFLKKIHLPAT